MFERWPACARNLIKIDMKVVRHGRYVMFPMAEVTVPRRIFQEILVLITPLRGAPARRGFEVQGRGATIRGVRPHDAK
jgi:hypothetical protein